MERCYLDVFIDTSFFFLICHAWIVSIFVACELYTVYRRITKKCSREENCVHAATSN